MLWSPAPKEAYTVVVDGLRIGVGAHPGVVNEGVWNLFWASSTKVDEALDHEGDPWKIIDYTSMLPIALGTGFQHYHKSYLIHQLASDVSQEEFIDCMKKFKGLHSLLAFKILNTAWLEILNRRLTEYKKPKEVENVVAGVEGKVISINFGGN